MCNGLPSFQHDRGMFTHLTSLRVFHPSTFHRVVLSANSFALLSNIRCFVINLRSCRHLHKNKLVSKNASSERERKKETNQLQQFPWVSRRLAQRPRGSHQLALSNCQALWF